MKRSIARYVYALVILMFTGFFISGCGGDGSTGHWDGEDTAPPTVTTTVPVSDATAVAIGNSLTATFSEAMDPLTITDLSFTLTDGVTPVTGAVTYSGVTAVFNPLADLAFNTTYTATITTVAEDLAGNPLASDHVWSFTTGAAPDTTAPTVTLTVPADGATAVALGNNLTATFSEAMDPLTITNLSFTLTNGVNPVTGAVTYSGVTAVFNPLADLAFNTTYIATITTVAADLAGNPLASDYVWSFTTGAVPDTTAPTVTSTIPTDAATGVAIGNNLSATFSEAMDPLTITNLSFTLTDGVNPVTGAVTYSGVTAVFNPLADLAFNTTYTATMTTVAADLAGNPLASDFVWSFTTVSGLGAGPLPVDLGLAANFAVLTKSGITTTGVTNITGDIGVSPIDATAITGFGLIMDSSNQFATSPSVTGVVYAANYAEPTPTNMTTTINDLHTAYVDAAGRTVPAAVTELGAGNISGMTLAAGLYKWSTGVLVDPSTTVTLTGGANDVWIFQIAQDLTFSSAASVALSGGAQAQNVFWQVGGPTGVTLEPGSHLEGIILAAKGIEVKDGATVHGRLLGETNVTLISNTITQP